MVPGGFISSIVSTTCMALPMIPRNRSITSDGSSGGSAGRPLTSAIRWLYSATYSDSPLAAAPDSFHCISLQWTAPPPDAKHADILGNGRRPLFDAAPTTDHLSSFTCNLTLQSLRGVQQCH